MGAIALLAGLARADLAAANDTTAGLAAGGLVFTVSDDIEMRSEDLSISRDEVAVRYRFFNHAATDQTVTVAFPMPEVPESHTSNVAVPDGESDNFLGFRTLVDGREVVAEIEQKALHGESDVTARLKALGLPLQPTAGRTLAALAALSEDVRARLHEDKLVGIDQGYGIVPLWHLRTTYHWRQTFLSGRELVVEHAYRPSVGSAGQTSVLSARAEPRYARFCPDDAFIAGVAAATAKNRIGPPAEAVVSYVLTTGANWAGPIRDFHLTIDKGAPKALISFCETGVVKTGPTTFEVRKTDFTPTRDIDILIVEAPQ